MKNPNVRLCTLRRWENYPGFGLHLTRTENGKGMQIGEIEQNSPASTCGLLTGDKVIEINGKNIENEMFMNILQMLQAELKNDTIRFLVTDKDVQDTHVDENYPNIVRSETPKRTFPVANDNINEDAAVVASLLSKAQGEPWENILNNVVQNMNIISPRPAEAKPVNAADLDKEFKEALRSQKISRDQSWYRGNADLERLIIPFKRRNLRATVAAIKKQPGFVGFGMLLSPDPDVGHVISEVVSNSPAEKANIHRGDTILQIGDEVVLHYPYQKLVEKLQNTKDDTIFLSIAPKQVILKCALEHIPILTQYDVNKATTTDHPFQERPDQYGERNEQPPTKPSYQRPVAESVMSTHESYGKYNDTVSPRQPRSPSPLRNVPSMPRSPSPVKHVPSMPPTEVTHNVRANVPVHQIVSDKNEPNSISPHEIDKTKTNEEKPKEMPPAVPLPQRSFDMRDEVPKHPGQNEPQTHQNYMVPELRTSMPSYLTSVESESLKSLQTDDHDTKLVVIEHTKPDGSYGFEIEQEAYGSYLVVSVDPDSPAARSGLKAGDRIMDVENFDATKGSLVDLMDQINRVISHGPLHMIVLTPVISEDAYKHLEDEQTHPSEYEHTRTLVIKKGNNISLGFELKTLEVQGDSEKIHALGNITPGLPADLAGVKEGDRLLSVNGTNVDGLSHHDVLALMKQKSEKLTFVVVDDENVRAAIVSDTNHARQAETNKNESTSPKVQETPSGTLTFVLIPNPTTKSLGMRLTPNLRIHAVDTASPASEAGLKVGDLVVKVDGTEFTAANHQAAFDLLRKGIANGKVTLEIKRSSETTEAEKTPAEQNTALESKNSETVTASPTSEEHGRTATGKVCVITNLQVGKPIGISIKENKGMPQEITRVAPKSPADGLGINPGDLILKINDEDVTKQSFEEVKVKMTDSVKNGTLKLEVIDPYSYLEIQGNVEHEVHEDGIPETRNGNPSNRPPLQFEEPGSKTQSMIETKSSEGSNEGNVSLGVKIATRDGRDHYIKFVEPGSLAFESGLHEDDVITSINGENVQGKYYETVLEKLVAAINSGTTVLVVDSKRKNEAENSRTKKPELRHSYSYTEKTNTARDKNPCLKPSLSETDITPLDNEEKTSKNEKKKGVKRLFPNSFLRKFSTTSNS